MRTHESGFIALIATIVIASLLVAVAFRLSMTNFFARLSLLENEYKERSNALAEACADTALLKRATNSGYIGNETIPVGSSACSIFPIVLVGGNITIQTKGIFQHAVTNINIVANNTNLSIVSWTEIPTL